MICMRVRKFSVICFCVFITHTSYSQFSKGDKMTGATIGAAYFNGGKTDATYPPPTAGFTRTERNFGINLFPNYGWFVSENTAIGATIIISYDHNKSFSEDAR